MRATTHRINPASLLKSASRDDCNPFPFVDIPFDLHHNAWTINLHGITMNRLGTALALIFLNLTAVGSLLPWILVAAAAGMGFDAPGSERRIGPYLFAVPVFLYPIIVIVSIAGTWARYFQKSDKATAWAGLPFVYAATVGICLWATYVAVTGSAAIASKFMPAKTQSVVETSPPSKPFGILADNRPTGEWCLEIDQDAESGKKLWVDAACPGIAVQRITHEPLSAAKTCWRYDLTYSPITLRAYTASAENETRREAYDLDSPSYPITFSLNPQEKVCLKIAANQSKGATSDWNISKVPCH